jgi:iron complex transport system ATP-binding protein
VQIKPVLSLLKLGIRRGDTVILDDISWKIMPGEHWAILGANGSGKTSLLSALTAYLPPTEGTIDVLQKRFGCANWPELRLKIGLVSSAIRQMMPDSEPALETIVSGKFAMIDFWGRITNQDRRRASAILRQIECEYLADRPWGYLSQGERQRVLIGRALMGKPRLLILDEPCAGLDPAAREQFLYFVERLGRQHRAPTLILVTHHVEEIMPVFSHVLMLKQGRILAAGKKKELITSKWLTKAFDTEIRISHVAKRYQISVRTRKSVAI